MSNSFAAMIFLPFLLITECYAWTRNLELKSFRFSTSKLFETKEASSETPGLSLHGDNACFMPLQQLDQDYNAPRIVQIAGAYPGLTVEEYFAVTSEPSPEPGQWTYDFSDPDGPQLGTVAIEGSAAVSLCEDPIVIIAEHTSLGVPLPPELTDPVDLIVLVDRNVTTFAERAFMVMDYPDIGLEIGAFASKAEMPPDVKIIGRVQLVQIPWLPAMKPTKSGFIEIDEYF